MKNCIGRNVHEVIAIEWDVPGHEFIKNDAQRPNIAALIRRFAVSHLLGRHVIRRSHDRIGRGQLRRIFGGVIERF